MKPIYRVLIIEDEPLAREVIKTYLKQYSELELVGEAGNGFEGLKAINEGTPDLIFLDIQMPKLTGFEMLELLENPPVIIFTTAYDQYALKAFQVSAADYLLKPYSSERFAEAIERARLFLKDRPAHQQTIQKLRDHRDENTEQLDRIVVKDHQGIRVVPTEQLIYIEAQDDYVMLHCEDKKFLKQKTMKYFESALDSSQFIRLHRSYIVRLSAIKSIERHTRDSHVVILKNGATLPVSKSGYKRLREQLD